MRNNEIVNFKYITTSRVVEVCRMVGLDITSSDIDKLIDVIELLGKPDNCITLEDLNQMKVNWSEKPKGYPYLNKGTPKKIAYD